MRGVVLAVEVTLEQANEIIFVWIAARSRLAGAGMTEPQIIRARIAELEKILANLRAALRDLEIDKAMFALLNERITRTTLQ